MEPETIALSEKRIGEIVSKNYHTAGIFRKYGIDFCCGGGITLEKACRKNGLNLREVEVELTAVLNHEDESGNNFMEWSPSFLMDYIENTHHNFVRKKTAEIGFYAEKAARVHGEHFPENIRIRELFSLLTDEMITHMHAEEAVVFPLIRKISKLKKAGKEIPSELSNDLKKELADMENDHEGAGSLMKQIREAAHNFVPPADACTTWRIMYQNLHGFEKDLHKHVHLENNILFPKAEQMITGQ